MVVEINLLYNRVVEIKHPDNRVVEINLLYNRVVEIIFMITGWWR